MLNWIRNHPVFSYLIFVIAWSWGSWSFLFAFIQPGGLLHNPPAITFLFAILGGVGPSLAGIVLTKIIYGKAGMKAIAGRFRAWRLGRWWLAALVIPALTFLLPLARFIAGYPVDFAVMAGLVVPGLVIGVLAGFMEEFGWRGFLLPHLLRRFSPLASTLLIGLIWGGLWHGYADYFGLGDRGLYFWPLVFLLGPCVLTAWSLLLTWAYKGTNGSLIMSIVMHASISSSAFIFGQKYNSDMEEIAWTAMSVGFSLAISFLVFKLLVKKEPIN